MSTTEAEKAGNAHKVRMKQKEVYGKIKRQAPKFKTGQAVRISKLRGQFDIGYKNQFMEEIYKITVFTRLPVPSYEIRNAGRG